MTANATAPAPAASVNNHVGAGGACDIASIVSLAAIGASPPVLRSSIALIAEATRPMSTPIGFAANSEISMASPSSA